MSADSSNEFKNFTTGLAREIKHEEKRRFIRLAIFISILTMILLGLLIRMQSNDTHLREQLRGQCEARNQILDLQRQTYESLVISAQTPTEQRQIWSEILMKLPEDRRCADFIEK